MKISHPRFGPVFLAALIVAPVSGLFAQTVQFYGVSKRVNYLQSSSATPVISPVLGDPDGTIYHMDVAVQGTGLNLFSSIKLTLPNTTQYTLVDKGTATNTEFGFGQSGPVHGFASKSALDAAFANGTYTVTVGTTAVPLLLGASDTYPAEIPTVTGGTWDANGKLVINAVTGATITFNTFSSYAGGGYIGGNVYTISSNFTGNQVVQQTNINVTGFMTDPLATSFTVAPNVLLPGQTYYGELTFGRLTTGNGTSIPNALGHADFDYLTGFMIRTLGGFADFNADAKTDLVWSNTSTGDRYLWLMNGTSYSSSVFLGVMTTPWQIAATGDFNGDGKTDLVWQNNSTGDRYLWLMNGTGWSSSISLGVVPIAWQINGTGDFNGDGKTDLVWTNTSTGERYLWLMNGSSFSSGVSLGVVPTQWQIAGTGDFNGDGKTDLVWTNTSTGERYLWLMNGTAFSSSVFLGIMPTQWKITGTGDFNGDGKTDLVWTNTSTGERYIWLMNGTSYSSSVFLGIVPAVWTITP